MESIMTADINSAPKISRVILRKGQKSLPVKTEEIVFFYTESKIVFAVDRFFNKFICEHSLNELESLLPPLQFFRANRQTIINIDYIKAFNNFDRVKLAVELAVGDFTQQVIVSQNQVPSFRRWITGRV